MSKKLASAIFKRSTAIERLNEALVVAREAKVDGTKLHLMLAYRGNLETVFNNLSSIHNQIIGLIPDDDEVFEQHDAIRRAAEKTYYEIKALHAQLSESGSSTVTPVQAQPTAMMHTHKLPKISLPTFDGDFKTWSTFYDLYCSVVHNNSLISNIEKFHHLLTSLTKEPLALVKTVAMTGDNYPIAFQMLVKRYQNKRYLATRYWNEIVSASSLQKGSPTDLRHLLDLFSKNLASLESLQFCVGDWDFVLFNMLLNKLDTKTRTDFEIKFNKVELPSFQQLCLFLDGQCRALESVHILSSTNKQSHSSPTPTQKRSSSSFTTSTTNTSCKPCIICNVEHPLYRCPVFASKPVGDRFDFVKKNNLCINCLSSTHMLRQCNSTSSCRTCKAKHHSLLHRERSIVVPEFNEEPAPPVLPQNLVLNASTAKKCDYTVMLSTAIVDVLDSRGNYQQARILFDSGSMANFISQECVKRLGLPFSRMSIPIEGLNNTSLSGTRGLTRCLIKPCAKSSPTWEFKAIVLQRICSEQPKFVLNPSQWSHIKGLNLADSKCYIPGAIDILIGAELVPYIFSNNRLFGGSDQPVAIQTDFGWVLQGKAACSLNQFATIFSFHAAMEKLSLNSLLERFWKVDSVPEKSHLSPEDLQCESHFGKTTKRDSTGRFVVSLPFRYQRVDFGDTYSQALRRFFMLEKRFLQNSTLKKEYCKFMQEYLDSGYMSPINLKETRSCKAYYIPHHCVVKPDSSTTRLRVVFDASAKGTSGLSLNDALLTGPKLQNDIFSILLLFRRHAVAFMADIRKMYLQIMLTPEHRDFQRIVWRFSTDQKVQEYRLNTVTFGISCSPYLALRTIHELAIAEKSKYPLASEVAQKEIYVDDVVTGADCVETALLLKDQLVGLFESAGFELRKWSSNEPRLLADDEPADSPFVSFDREEPAFVKVLGLRWNTAEDAFSYACQIRNTPTTKRGILSEIARVYDPLGFLSPVILVAKQLMQTLWSENSDWDESVSQTVRDAWSTYQEELPLLRQIRIPRYIPADRQARIELHGFADASSTGYGAVVYLRLEFDDGSVSTFLCCAKSKVPPMKTVSIPRLELLGAVLLTNLILKITDLKQFHLDRIFAWTDSEIVLAWLSAMPCRWKTFVANRVAHIQESLPTASWQYVPSNDNPADCASRGILPAALCNHKLWWNGPSWLTSAHRPSQPSLTLRQTDIEIEQAKSSFVASVNSCPFSRLLDKFSSLSKLQRIIGYVLRFVSNTRTRNKIKGAISPIEMNHALTVWVKHAQRVSFTDVLDDLKSFKLLSKPIRKLNPFIDEFGLIRVGGRLRHSSLAFEKKHPLLLANNHPLTDRIVLDAHCRHLHPGFKTLSNILAQKFWIMSPRKAINRCISRCWRCFKANPKPIAPFMGDLPAFRVNQAKAFLSVCLDYAGPFLVTPLRRRGSKTVKTYVCMFVCCATKAVHLELANDLSSEAFLSTFQRFVSRRGRCTSIYSDQGTNFIGANRLLNELANLAATKLEIVWHVNPPSAPHFNGLAEAGVKSVKTHLNRVVGSQILSIDEFHTLLVRIEAVLNSRPLCPLSSDPNDLQPLTPAHFLLMEPIGNDFPSPDFSDVAMNRLSRFQLLSRMLSHFWTRWSDEYLHTLQQREKWTKSSWGRLEVDSLVLVKNDQLPPNKWSLARVMSLHPGQDGIIRVATLRMANGIFQRPLVKVCPLPTTG